MKSSSFIDNGVSKGEGGERAGETTGATRFRRATRVFIFFGGWGRIKHK